MRSKLVQMAKKQKNCFDTSQTFLLQKHKLPVQVHNYIYWKKLQLGKLMQILTLILVLLIGYCRSGLLKLWVEKHYALLHHCQFVTINDIIIHAY